jgi:hypothetical protein
MQELYNILTEKTAHILYFLDKFLSLYYFNNQMIITFFSKYIFLFLKDSKTFKQLFYFLDLQKIKIFYDLEMFLNYKNFILLYIRF